MADMDSILSLSLVNCKESDDNSITGYVDGVEKYSSINDTLKSFGYLFSTRSSKAANKKDDIGSLLFQYNNSYQGCGGAPPIEFFGSPFTIEKTILLQCSQGPIYYKRKITKPCKELSDHVYLTQKRVHCLRTKKVNCPARMSVRCIKYFPDVTVDETSKWKERNKIITQLKYSIKSDKPPRSVLRFYISASKQECHSHARNSTIITQETDTDLIEEIVPLQLCSVEHLTNCVLPEENVAADIQKNVVSLQNITSCVLPEENVAADIQKNVVPVVFNECNSETDVKSLQRMLRDEITETIHMSYLITDPVVLKTAINRQKDLNTVFSRLEDEQFNFT